MKITVVSRTRNEDGKKVPSRSITVEYEVGNSLSEAVSLFGEEVVWSAAKAELLTSVRDRVRPMLEAGKSDEEIQSALSNWRIGERVSAPKSGLKKFMKLFERLSPEERAETLKRLSANI